MVPHTVITGNQVHGAMALGTVHDLINSSLVYALYMLCISSLYNYRLSLMNQHNAIVLHTELDDLCDKLAVDRRIS